MRSLPKKGFRGVLFLFEFKKMKRLILFLSFLSVGFFNVRSAFSQTKDVSRMPYLTLEKMKIRPLSGQQERLIIKSAINIVMRSQKYQLLFSSPKSYEAANFKFNKLLMAGEKQKFGKNKKGYFLTFQLIDSSNNEVIREVTKKYIEKRHLVFKSKLLLYELFFSKKKSLKLENDLRLETEKELSDARVGLGNKKKINRKNQIGQGKNKKDEIKKNEKNNPDDIDKNGLRGGKKKNKKPLTKPSVFESPDLDLKKDELDTRVNPPKVFSVYSEYSYSIEYSSLKVSSKSVIDVENDLRMVGAMVSAAVQLEEKSLNRIYMGLKLNKITSDNLFKVSPPTISYLLYDFGSLQSFIRFQGGLEFETQSFANLGTKGEGIRPWNGSFLWMKGGLVFDFVFLNRRMGLGGYFYSPFAGSSDFNVVDSEIALTGSKFEAFISGQIYNSWHIQLSYNRADITSQGSSNLENQHSIASFSLVYK